MKKILLYIISFAVFCSLCNYGIDYSIARKIANRSPINLALASIGANSSESRLDGWAKIDAALSLAEMEQSVQKILAVLDIPLDKEKIKIEQTQESTGIRYSYAKGNEHIDIIAESNHKQQESCYLLCISVKNMPMDIGGYEKKLQPIKELDWHYYYLFTGELNAIISSDSQKELLQVLMKNLDAETEELYSDGQASSITGYSKTLKPRFPVLQCGNKKYNVQAAIRNTQQNKAVVYIGVPLILGEY